MITAMEQRSFVSPAAGSAHAERVVLIDDDPDILDALSQLLRIEGYAVETHGCASDYIRSLQGCSGAGELPACIVCDVMMPEMDGLQLQALLGEQGHVGMVLMSGASGVQEAVQAFRAGATDFLLKPVSNSQLTQAVARAVAETHQNRQKSQRREALSQQVNNLSEREWEVMRGVAAGITNLGLSLQLGITERTVKFHRQRLLEKLALSGTADLARLVQELEQLGLAQPRSVSRLDPEVFPPRLPERSR